MSVDNSHITPKRVSNGDVMSSSSGAHESVLNHTISADVSSSQWTKPWNDSSETSSAHFSDASWHPEWRWVSNPCFQARRRNSLESSSSGKTYDWSSSFFRGLFAGGAHAMLPGEPFFKRGGFSTHPHSLYRNNSTTGSPAPCSLFHCEPPFVSSSVANGNSPSSVSAISASEGGASAGSQSGLAYIPMTNMPPSLPAKHSSLPKAQDYDNTNSRTDVAPPATPDSDGKDSRSEKHHAMLLKFGDQTLSFLQRQQMNLWSALAFRDWRVKTLVHALSAMGAPVDLVVVDCAVAPESSLPGVPSANAHSRKLDRFWSASEAFTDSRLFDKPQPRIEKIHSAVGDAASEPAARSRFAEQSSKRLVEASAPTSVQSLRSLSADSLKSSTRSLPQGNLASLQYPAAARSLDAHPQTEIRGGYSPIFHTVWLCGNRLWSPFELRRVLLHELTHAFDFARADISPDDCHHIACTEIRAYNLSGQCGWWRTRKYDMQMFDIVASSTEDGKQSAAAIADTQRKEGLQNFAISQMLEHKQSTENTDKLLRHDRQQTKRNRCLTYGALNSLKQHRSCNAPGSAEEAIEAVFARCLRDTWPFLAPPERDSRWRPSRMWRGAASDFFTR